MKVAASAAPVIATLQSGAALANASTRQCIISSRKQTDNAITGDPEKVDAFLASEKIDNFIRQPGTQRDVYLAGAAQPESYYKLGSTWYRKNGSTVPTTNPPWANLNPCTANPPNPPVQQSCYVDTEKYFVTAWTPQPDGIFPTNVDPAGVWPQQRDFDTHTALAGSCLCSVDAGFAEGTTANCRS